MVTYIDQQIKIKSLVLILDFFSNYSCQKYFWNYLKFFYAIIYSFEKYFFLNSFELKNCCGKKIAPYSSARIREDDKHHYCYYFNELDFQSNTQYYIVVDGKRENKIS